MPFKKTLSPLPGIIITATPGSTKEEEGIVNNQQLLSLIENISHVGSWILDLQTNKMIWSDELYKIVGYAPGEVEPTNENRFSFIHKDDRDNVAAIYKKAIETGGDYFLEKRIVRPDGSIRNILSQGRVEKDNNGIPCKLVGIFKDITHEKRLLEDLKRSAEYFKGAFDNSAIGMALIGVEGGWKEVNDSTCNIVGYSRRELMQLTFQDITHPDDLAADLKYLNELIDGKRKSYQMEKRYFHKKGHVIWVLLVVSVVKDKEGKVLHFIAQIEDITDRKNIEKALLSSEEKYKLLFYSSPLPKWIYDIETLQILDVNEPAIQHYGYSRKDFLKMTMWDILTEVEKPDTNNLSNKTLSKKNSIVFNVTGHRKKNGDIIKVEVSGSPINFNERACMIVVCNDITEKFLAEEALKLSNKRFEYVTKATNDSIWDWDLITNEVIRPGKRLETLFGYVGCQPDVVDAFWIEHVHPADWAKLTKKRNALFADPTQQYWEDEYRFLTTTGEYAYVLDKGYIIRNEHGKAIRMIGASQDITQEKEQVNEIIRIQQNLDSLINTTSDLIWSINKDFKIIAANKAFRDAVYSITGQYVKEGDEVISPSAELTGMDKWSGFYERALAGETFHFEQSLLNAAIRNPWYVIISFCPIINKKGMVSGVACFAKDVTELKKAGQKLLELNKSLEKRAQELAASNSELERFAYVASHDLQEPLRMVSSFLQLLEKKYNAGLDDVARKYIHFSVDGADRMKQLINDLLQYSRIGTASLEVVPVNMNEVLQEVLMVYKNEMHSIDAEFIIENLPVIHAGKSAMLQLMQNLVGNALKYRSIEKPVVTITCKEQSDQWVFTVKDNGIGIDPKFNDKIFIIFQRLHNKDQFKGTGIGLAICKKILERYQGKIWVESEFGKGSKFIFAIPKKIT